MNTYGGANIWIVLIWLWTWKINPWALRTTTQDTFQMWLCIVWWWIYRNCCHCHVICYLKHMIYIWHDSILICLKWTIVHSTRRYFLCITALIFQLFKKRSHYDNNGECMILADMQHSHTHTQILLRGHIFELGWKNIP